MGFCIFKMWVGIGYQADLMTGLIVSGSDAGGVAL